VGGWAGVGRARRAEVVSWPARENTGAYRAIMTFCTWREALGARAGAHKWAVRACATRSGAWARTFARSE